MSILAFKKIIISIFLFFLVLYNCNAQVSTINTSSQSVNSFLNKTKLPPIQDVVPLAFQQIGEESGMPKYISGIEQDEQGFLWIGSQSGLFRYDGVVLKQFKHIEEDTTSLMDSSIDEIYIDHSNTLWVITESYVLHRYDAHLEQFHRVRLIPATKDTIPVEVANIIQDKYGVLWLATYTHGLNQLDISTGKLTPISTAELGTYSSFSKFLEDRNGNIWTKSNANLFCVFLGKEASAIDSVKAYLAGAYINTLMEDTDGTIWIGGGNTQELYYIPSGYKKLLKYKLEVNSLNDEHEELITLAQASNGNIWIGSSYWLGIINPTLGQQTFYDAENGLPEGMTIPSISSFFVDQTGGIVLGSWGGGISYNDPNLARFGHFQHLPNNTNSLSNSDINGIYEAESGAIWVATIEGLNKFDRPTGQVKRFVPQLPLSPYIYSVATTSKRRVWVGSNAGLLVLNPTSGQFSRWKSPTKAGKYLESDLIYYLQKEEDGTLWVVSQDDDDESDYKLSFFDETLGDFRLFNLMHRNKQIRVNQSESGYVLDASNLFWLISEEAQLFSFNIQTEALTHFPISTTIIEQIRKQEFSCLLKDQQDRIWIGTGKGLYLLTPSNGTKDTYNTKRFTEKDGLPDNSIWGLLEDNKGNIWSSTSNGLSKLDPETMVFRNYSKADGLQGDSYYTMKSALKSPTTGELYFAGLNGFNVFNSDSITNNPIPPSLSITRVEVFRDSSMQRIIPELSEGNPKIELFHGDKLLKIKYVSPNIGHPEMIQYAVQLEGYDKDWRYVGNENEAVYTNLDPKDYVFRVKAANKDGTWNEVATALTIIVYPPWWRTKWAYGIYLLLFSGGLYALYHFQRKKDQEKAETLRLQEMAQLKSRFFGNVSHELRTPLTLILGPLDATLKRNKLDAQDATYLKMARRSGHQLRLLVNSLLDLSKLEIKQLALQEKVINLYPLMSHLLAPFELSAKVKGIHLSSNDLPDVPLNIQLDVPKFEIIINNLLSNALKFTPKGGNITVHVQAHQQQIEIKVSDTGKGIAAEDLPFIFDRYFQTKQANQPLEGGTGIGLALSKEYAQLFKGDISVSSILGESSTFTLIFPKKAATEIAAYPIESILAPAVENNLIELLPIPNSKEQEAKPKLLIVEDNKDMRLYIQSILQNTFQCFTAENGQIAWDWLNDATNIPPDIIISDLMMPVLDGFALLKKLKASDQWRTTPVIMLTARSAKEVRLKALTIGIDDYLTKPFDAEELVVRVNSLLQNHLARKIQSSSRSEKEVQPEFKPVMSADIDWLHEVTESIKTDIGKKDLNLLHIAREMAISERHLRRRILEITGMNSGAYLKEIKLQKARHFLELKAYKSAAEVWYVVGFNTPSYFSKIYKNRFGKLPSEYF